MKTVFAAAVLLTSLALAAPPPGASRNPAGQPGQADGAQGGRREERERRARMLFVVGAAEALNLTEAEALRLGDKLKGYEERRRPVREQMHEGMKVLRAASQGDTAALPQVDAAVQRVLDGRAQMAQLDKEMFAGLSQGMTPQRRAQLAVFIARFHQAAAKLKGGEGHGRRHGRPNGRTDF